MDEKQYRFSFYYEQESWWHRKGIKPYFRAYERPKDKWLIYLWVLFKQPYAIIFVQLSLKNFILTKLCNIFYIKAIFWQHGVFRYEEAIIKKYRQINASLNYLLSFSQYDNENIAKYFKKVRKSKFIKHYETIKIRDSKTIDNSVLYIGQIITAEQIKDSGSKIKCDDYSEKILNETWNYLGNSSFQVFLRKHPGDKSSYLEKITKEHKNFRMIDEHIIPSIIIGHYSTLIIPYLQMGIPFVQIEHKFNTYVDFTNYSKQPILTLNSLSNIKLENFKINETNFIDTNSSESISATLASCL